MKKIICHDINGKEFEVDSEKLIFRPSVYGILIENGKILLTKEWDGYNLPGGGVNIDETLEEALKREFKEETGLDIEIKKTIHSQTSFFWPNYLAKYENIFWNCPTIYYLVERVGGEISIDNCDEDEKARIDLPKWIELEKAREMKHRTSEKYIFEIIEKLFKK